MEYDIFIHCCIKFPLKKILIKSSSHFQNEFPLNLLQDLYVLYATNNINFRMPILGKADATTWENLKVCRKHIAQKSRIFWTIFSLWEFALQTNFYLNDCKDWVTWISWIIWSFKQNGDVSKFLHCINKWFWQHWLDFCYDCSVYSFLLVSFKILCGGKFTISYALWPLFLIETKSVWTLSKHIES